MRRTSLFWLLVWTLVGVVVLCGLGTWQLFRLQEKRDFLASLEARLKAPALPFEQAWQQRNDAEFLKVQLEGSFAGPSLYLQTTFDGGPGWRVLTPFVTPGRLVVLVDRGKIPASLRGDATLNLEGAQTLQAIIRHHDQEQGIFDPENDAEAGTWYWWDVPAMLATLKAPSDHDVAGYIVQALPEEDAALLPKPEAVSSGVSNNHLGYALTWFSLALCLVAISGIMARRETKLRKP
jgi:surfeit locus 1 family protein